MPAKYQPLEDSDVAQTAVFGMLFLFSVKLHQAKIEGSSKGRESSRNGNEKRTEAGSKPGSVSEITLLKVIIYLFEIVTESDSAVYPQITDEPSICCLTLLLIRFA